MNNLIPDNVMELKILKQKWASGSSLVKNIWKPLYLKTCATFLSAEIIREQSDTEAETILLPSDSLYF